MVKYFFSLCLILFLYSCSENEKEYKTLYLTTDTSDIYCFDLTKKQLLWHSKPENEYNNELTFFTIKGDKLIKAYLDCNIVQFNKSNGKKEWQLKDTISSQHQYYDYDFDNVRYAMFSQYPAVYKDNIIFGNSKGEIKSVNPLTKKVNWIYQNPNPIITSPKILNNILFINLGYDVISLNLENGKMISRITFDRGIPNEVVFDEDKIYVVTEYGSVFCLNENLEIVWEHKRPLEKLYINKNVFIHHNNLYFGNKVIIALNKTTGDLQWEHKLDNKDGENSLLSIDKYPDGIIVNTTNSILKISKSGRIIKEKKFYNKQLFGEILSSGKHYFYTTTDGKLYSIDEELEKEEIIYDKINLSTKKSFENTYMYAE